MKIPSTAAALLGLVITAAPAPAEVIFSEDFEFPEVTGYERSIPNLRPVVGWIGSGVGFKSNERGLVNKDGGDFSVPDPNHQGYAFRYTNSGLTTAENVIDDLQLGGTYTVSFDVVRDDGLNSGTPYRAELVAFGPSDGNAARTECRGGRPGTILADAVGDAPGDGSVATVSFDFTADPGTHATDIGRDLGIRFIGATTSAIIDNVQLEVDFPMLVSPEYMAWLDAGDIDLTWNNLPANIGSDTWVDVWFGTDPGALSQVVDADVDGMNRTTVTVNAPTDGTYYWRVDSYLDGGPTGTPVEGSLFVFQIGVPPQPGDEILPAVTALEDHITGASPLSAGEIEDIIDTLVSNQLLFGVNAATIQGCLDLVETYDSVIGPIWVSGSPKAGGFTRATVVPDIHWAVYSVMQSIMDDIYKADVLAAHEGILDGFSFESASNFPGWVDPPAPGATHTATISGSYADTFGRNTQGDGPGTFARKPTGTYLAPGTIATVTVPASLVDTGFLVRVGCHSWDFSNRPSIKRLDRISRTYPIEALQTKVANPHGGGIYIEVPFGAAAGVVTVDIAGAVRSPYFSAKSFHTTTIGEWQTTERNHTAPWADFQTEKFMLQVPTNWIYAMDDPATLLADWDAAMDAMNDLMGFPHIRGKETMYPQVDILNRASVYAPGYPSVNTKDNPNNDNYSGYRNHHLVRGPQNAPDYEFHEQGHAYFFPKFGGESESNVNLPHVAVQHRKFGETLDQAFAESSGFGGNANRNLDNTAVAWMCCFNFSPREVPMADWEKAYQLKGHAKFVDVVKIFGTWDGLDEYWRSYMEDDENGTLPASPTSTDELLLRMCRSTGQDIRPLFHFWGIVPQDRAGLEAAVEAESIPLSPDILVRLQYYRTLIPADNGAFQAFATSWWGGPPSINGFATEREHARQWDTAALYGSGDQQRSQSTNPGEIYNENSAADIDARLEEIIGLYYKDLDVTLPSPDPMSFALAPTATRPDAILMIANDAEDGNGVEYYFECLTPGGHDSGWQASPSYLDTGLSPNTEYSYVVRARDQSPNQNTTADSSPASATTGEPLPAGTLFIEGFEDPDVPGYTQGSVPYNVVPENVTWVGATQGYRANYRGLTDKAGGDFTAADPNQQAYAFRYTNSGLTTALGVIGELAADTTYTVSFDVVRDDGGGVGTWYKVELVAFGPGDDNATRNECRGARPGTILASTTGDAPGDGSFATITLEFTADPGTHAADIGKDLGIRFLGATTSAIIDNVRVTVPVSGNDFATWIAGFDVGGQTGLGDDFDLDGNGNAVENFLGTDPGVFSSGLVSGTVSGGTFTFTHPQNPNPASDLAAAYRWSKDLDSFHADGADDGAGTTVSFTAQLDTPETNITTVTATVTVGPVPDKLFVEVEVTQVP